MPAQKTILLNANHIFVWHKKFRPAQNIFGPVKGQGNSVYLLKYYDPQFVGISLQSPKSAKTPRIPTLLSKHLFIDHKQAFVTRKSDKASKSKSTRILTYIQRGIHTLLSQRYASEISQGVPF